MGGNICRATCLVNRCRARVIASFRFAQVSLTSLTWKRKLGRVSANHGRPDTGVVMRTHGRSRNRYLAIH